MMPDHDYVTLFLLIAMKKFAINNELAPRSSLSATFIVDFEQVFEYCLT